MPQNCERAFPPHHSSSKAALSSFSQRQTQFSPCVLSGFLPTLEKFGKTCQLLLGPEELFFLQTGLNTDGPHVSLRFQAVRCRPY